MTQPNLMEKFDIVEREIVTAETINETINKLVVQFNEKLMIFVRRLLEERGIVFDSKEKFLEFCKTNISKTSVDNFHTLFLLESGKLIRLGSYSDKIKVGRDADDFVQNKFTITIG